MTALLAVCAGLAALCFIIFAAVPALITKKMIGRSKTKTPPDYPPEEGRDPWLESPGLNVEQVSIESADGLTLKAYYAAGGCRDLAIIAHGYRGGAKLMGHYGRFFYEKLNCGVLLPDARAHGDSEGSYIGFGWPERLDMLRWIDWARRRGAERIVLFGVSMGAATMMMTAGENPPAEVKAVIEDCGYTSASEELLHVCARYYRLKGSLGRLVVNTVSKRAAKNAGYTFEEASAIAQLKKAALPFLFIHGEADDFVPFEMAMRLYDSYPREKELYTVKNAAHGFCWGEDSDEYEKRVLSFVRKYLP